MSTKSTFKKSLVLFVLNPQTIRHVIKKEKTIRSTKIQIPLSFILQQSLKKCKSVQSWVSVRLPFLLDSEDIFWSTSRRSTILIPSAGLGRVYWAAVSTFKLARIPQGDLHWNQLLQKKNKTQRYRSACVNSIFVFVTYKSWQRKRKAGKT